MKHKLSYFLVALCVLLAGINIYLLLDKDNSNSGEAISHDTELVQQDMDEEKSIGHHSSGITIQAVDLGLSVYWANCNLGAESPEAYGSFYTWGDDEMTTEENHTGNNYKYFAANSRKCYNLGANISATRYDAAHRVLGEKWRMPTADEIEELIINCSCTWGRYRDTEGIWVTSHNGNSIFLPRVGKNKQVLYWSATQNPNKDEEAYVLWASSPDMPEVKSCDRWGALHIRPVKDK